LPRKKTGQISVVGFDASDEARKAVLTGAMDATVAQSPATMGAMGSGERLPLA